MLGAALEHVDEVEGPVLGRMRPGNLDEWRDGVCGVRQEDV